MKFKVAALVISLAVVGGGFYLATKNKDDTKTSQTNTTTATSEKRAAAPDAPKLLAQTVGKDADCSMYTFADLTKVWGVPFVDTDINKVSELSTAGGKQYSCGYNQTDSGLGVTVTIEYREHPDVASAKQSMNDTRSTEKYGDTVYYLKQDVTDVGDEAFLWSKNRTAGSKELNQQLYVRNGSVVFLLSSVNLDGVDESYKDKLVATYKLHFE